MNNIKINKIYHNVYLRINKKTKESNDKYIQWLKRRDLSTNTINNYFQATKLYGKRPLTTSNLRNYVRDNLTKYEPSSIYTNVRALMVYARYQKVNINWEKVNRLVPKQQAKFFPTLTNEEMERIKKARFEISDWIYERNNLMIDFLFYTGLRVSELINIRHNNYQGEQLRIFGKGNKVRYVPLPPFLAKKINLYSNNYLFTTIQGKKLSRILIYQFIWQRTRVAGIKKLVSPHTFRRSLATLSNNKGIRLTTIQKVLGHSSIETTTSYIHNSYEEIYQDYSKLWTSSPPPLIYQFL